MAQQIPLAFPLDQKKRFDNFIATEADDFLLATLRQMVCGQGEQSVFIWGMPATGKTHLLQSSCQLASEQDMSYAYLPLRELSEYPPDVLSGLLSDLTCFDDIDALVDKPDWQQALFNCFNESLSSGHRMVFASSASPRESHLALPDLVSRLEWGPVFQLHSLNDQQKLEVLKLYAQQKKMDMDEDVLNYIFKRVSRELGSLVLILDRLDEASLIAKRRITIPFVRGELEI